MSDREMIQIFSSTKCLICGQSEREFSLGRFHELDEFCVHYICILTADRLAQKGNPREGLLGFLLCDILKAYWRYAKNTCAECKRSGASCICIFCKRAYHLPCGLKVGMTVQMLGCYTCCCPYCDQSWREKKKPTPGAACSICLGPLGKDNLYSPTCCNTNELIHIKCLQQYALMSGYLMKCPLCSNKHSFRVAVRKAGIYIPNEDASWLLEGEDGCVPTFRMACSARVCEAIDNVQRNSLVSCRVCRDFVAHYGCTLSGIFLCTECTHTLWPKKCLSVMRKGDTCLYSNASQSLSLVIENDEIKTLFPWFVNLLVHLLNEEFVDQRVFELAIAVEMELVADRKSRWYEALEDAHSAFIADKIKEIHENPRGARRDRTHPRFSFSERLQPLEVDVRRAGPSGSKDKEIIVRHVPLGPAVGNVTVTILKKSKADDEGAAGPSEENPADEDLRKIELGILKLKLNGSNTSSEGEEIIRGVEAEQEATSTMTNRLLKRFESGRGKRRARCSKGASKGKCFKR